MSKVEKDVEVSLLDFIVIFVKNKKFLIGTTFLSMIIFYLVIFFFVDEQFESTATIVPSQESSISGIAGMLGGLGDLPFGIGGTSNTEVGLYNTILQSRTTIKTVIEKFNLWEVYEYDKTIPQQIKNMYDAVSESIFREETDDGAYILTVRTSDAQLSADIVNFLVSYLNKKIINLKVDKSRNNRIFLEERLADIRHRLELSEDSLKYYQQETGIIEPQEQTKALLTVYTELEQNLMTKQMQKEVLEHIYDKNSPQLKKISLEVDLFENRFNELKRDGKKNSIFIPYNSIPEKAIDYYRYFREVEINQSILKFILPLYEQAKIEEQKKLPILQVIDDAIPAEIKSYPRRALSTILFGIIVFLILFTFILIKENKNLVNSEQFKYIQSNLFKLKNK
jgi:capsule polysaccharide export protein KpsE/RkpR